MTQKILSAARRADNYKASFKVRGEYKLIDNGITPEATVTDHSSKNGYPPERV